MLHPAVVRELLEQEAVVARESHGSRLSSLEVVGTDVLCTIEGTNVGTAVLRFDGSRYDAEPLGLNVINADGTLAPQERWPGNLCHGMHPPLNRLFACIQGTFEYHTYPGHTNDPWDRHRAAIRLVNLLDHVLRRAGK